jgi:hypothetical protein
MKIKDPCLQTVVCSNTKEIHDFVNIFLGSAVIAWVGEEAVSAGGVVQYWLSTVD